MRETSSAQAVADVPSDAGEPALQPKFRVGSTTRELPRPRTIGLRVNIPRDMHPHTRWRCVAWVYQHWPTLGRNLAMLGQTRTDQGKIQPDVDQTRPRLDDFGNADPVWPRCVKLDSNDGLNSAAGP